MARKKHSTSEFVMFDVVYADGTLSSHRKVSSTELSGFDGDAPAKSIVEAQDERIATVSGRPRREIKSITRSA